MFVCMYVQCVCIHACMHVCICVCTSVCVCECVGILSIASIKEYTVNGSNKIKNIYSCIWTKRKQFVQARLY
jgi:hypothetical protein